MNMEWSEGIGRYLADPSYLNDREIGLLRDWYTASVQYLDDELERFLEFYREELIDDTVLVLTADHGEQLGEHGLWAHSYYLYDETLKIPLIMVGPEVPSGAQRSDLASHVDLFGTLCDICGVETPQSVSVPRFSLSTIGTQYSWSTASGTQRNSRRQATVNI